jgi:arginine deiminase
VAPYVDSEVSRLTTVMLHRPGAELARLTPRNNDSLLFDGIPWVGRAQDEHDAFAEALRSRGVEVLYLGELLAETLEVSEARDELIAEVLGDRRLGDSLRTRVAEYLTDQDAPRLADVLMAGLAHEEMKPGPAGLVYQMATTSSSTRCPICCSPAIRRSGCGIGSRSPAWPCRPGPGRRH